MAHLKFKHIVTELAPGGNPEILKAELIQLALEHKCDIHANTLNGKPFYEIHYDTLMAKGVPEPK